jgi:RNA polymerase sigma-70 factor (ECF subfamily)
MGELGRRLARGDQAAFAELFDACAGSLHAWLVARLGSRVDADDVLQETFVRLARGRSRLARVDNLTAYVFTMARNEAIRWQARARHNSRRLNQLTATAAGPDEAAARETAEALQHALGQLPAEQREVLELKAYGGLTLAEIAAVTAQPAGTVASRYRAAVSKLRAWLAETHPE